MIDRTNYLSAIVLYCIGLPHVRKANVRMEFNVYVNSQSDTSVQCRRVCDDSCLVSRGYNYNKTYYKTVI